MSEALFSTVAAARRLPMTDGKRYVRSFEHGSMYVEYYSPIGTDPQEPHRQDELYVVISGTGVFRYGAERVPFEPGTVLFAPAGAPHRFEDFSDDFSTWVIFYGPDGGE